MLPIESLCPIHILYIYIHTCDAPEAEPPSAAYDDFSVANSHVAAASTPTESGLERDPESFRTISSDEYYVDP